MQPMTIPEIISAVDGTWLNPRKGAAPVTAVCTDSRKIAPGCLFLPWVGERFDGHDFIDRALDAGAAGCDIGGRPPAAVGAGLLYRLVQNALAAAVAAAKVVHHQRPAGAAAK